jgi:predicted branched-subunit amino acid permease
MITPTAIRSEPRSPTRRGLRDAAGLVPAVAPLGLALGAALAQSDAPPFVAWLTAPLMVAGAAQLVLITELDRGSAVLAAAAAALVLNSRFVVYGAALAHRFRQQPRWFELLGAHYVVDQTYGLVATRLDGDGDVDSVAFRRYFTAMGTLLAAVWTVTVGLGVVAGPLLPPSAPLEFVLPATFVAMVVPQIADRRHVAVVIAAAAIALTGIAPTMALVGAAAIGSSIGALPRGDAS